MASRWPIYLLGDTNREIEKLNKAKADINSLIQKALAAYLNNEVSLEKRMPSLKLRIMNAKKEPEGSDDSHLVTPVRVSLRYAKSSHRASSR